MLLCHLIPCTQWGPAQGQCSSSTAQNMANGQSECAQSSDCVNHLLSYLLREAHPFSFSILNSINGSHNGNVSDRELTGCRELWARGPGAEEHTKLINKEMWPPLTSGHLGVWDLGSQEEYKPIKQEHSVVVKELLWETHGELECQALVQPRWAVKYQICSCGTHIWSGKK